MEYLELVRFGVESCFEGAGEGWRKENGEYGEYVESGGERL